MRQVGVRSFKTCFIGPSGPLGKVVESYLYLRRSNDWSGPSLVAPIGFVLWWKGGLSPGRFKSRPAATHCTAEAFVRIGLSLLGRVRRALRDAGFCQLSVAVDQE